MTKKILLIGPSSPMGVCFQNEHRRHYCIFRVGSILYVASEFIPALKEAEVIFSFLTEEEAEILSRDIKLEVPSRNITKLEEAFPEGHSFSYYGDPKIYFVLPRTEKAVEVYRVWLGCTCEG